MSDAHLDHVESFSRYVFTSDGRLLLTMPGLAKKAWPGVWANSCYGHPAPGEALPDAVPRILRDELGLSAQAELIRPASRHGMRMDGEFADEFCPAYRVVTDQSPSTDPVEVGDFDRVRWAEFGHAVADV